MTQNTGLLVLISILLVLANAFFVAAEYALVGSRRSRIEAYAKRKKQRPDRLLRVLNDITPYVAGTQIGITMVGIAVGSVTEPFIRGLFINLLGHTVPQSVSFVISYLLITCLLVVTGELFPKYLTIRVPERVAWLTVGPLVVVTNILLPLVWLAQALASLLLKPFGINPNERRSEALPKDELLLLIRAGSHEGTLEEMQADLLSRSLKLEDLDAKDVMIHRLDIKSLDVATPKEVLFKALAHIPHSRVPVYEEDLDNLLGIVYVHDIIRTWDSPDFSLRAIAKPAVAVPENLTADKIITTMRNAKSQIVIVMDEYGGTSGLITLEDVVEEVFGELEDQLEVERPPIEILPNGRVTARADVRFDEIVAKLGIELPDEVPTDTLATVITNNLDHVPKLGDKVETELGTLYVENMARRRITRVSLLPAKDLKYISKGS
ncbi:MAG TPA: hemolysin family protein [Fimbriimonadaceae bacterium]|jgi:CBS domain containing-hemolysin-like protein